MDAGLQNRLGNGTVTNKAPTEGGKSVPQSMVTQADYDSAVAQLTAELREDLVRAADKPDGLPARGVVYPATVAVGDVVTVPPAGSVVNQLAPTTHPGDDDRVGADRLAG